jgi:outer membrane lipoprotein SlyB
MKRITSQPPAIPTVSRRPGWLLGLALAAVLTGVALAGALVGHHLAHPPVPAELQSQAQAPLQFEAPAAGSRADAPVTPTRSQRAPANAATTAPAAAPDCIDCGVIEAVQPQARKGPPSGFGAVAGGVVGGLLGNQMGKGDGRKAMTVIGAVGGGLAGNEIEKSQRARTVYLLRIRMDDGSLRSLVRAEPLAVGQRVAVDAQGAHPLPS